MTKRARPVFIMPDINGQPVYTSGKPYFPGEYKPSKIKLIQAYLLVFFVLPTLLVIMGFGIYMAFLLFILK